MAELTLEVLAYTHVVNYPWTGAPTPACPMPGRLAVLAHSNGNDVMSQFISNLRSAPAGNVLKDKLREIYMLDPAGGGEGAAFDNCAAYVKALADPNDGAFRCYSQNIALRFDDLHAALLRPNHPPAPYDDTSERLPPGKVLKGLLHRTAAFLPSAAWPNPPKVDASLEIHSYIPATMLTHALLSSAFPTI
jgi:hypothetical protein